MNVPFDRGDRIYYVSDERLRAFRALSTEEKLRWVEELATFLRLVQSGGHKPGVPDKDQSPPSSA